MTSPLHCFYCGTEIDPTGDYFQFVTGWEKPGRGLNSRSGSSLVLRQRIPDEVACVGCITQLQNGVHLAQETLL